MVSVESTPAGGPQNKVSVIPNMVWSFWAQGTMNLPPVIQTCIDTWHQNGGVDCIRVLDPISVSEYLTRDELPRTFSTLTPQMQSDAVRLALLAKYGGIWLDASTVVTSALMPWLDEVSRGEGFFLFQNPSGGRGGRLFEIGFMAVRSGHQFFEAWSQEFNLFFSLKRVHLAHSPTSDAPWIAKKTFGVLNKWLRKTPRRSSLWARKPLRLLPFYPYFITYYLANNLLLAGGLGHHFGAMKHVDSLEYLRLRSRVNRGELDIGLQEARRSEIPAHDVEFRHPFTQRDLRKIRAVRDAV